MRILTYLVLLGLAVLASMYLAAGLVAGFGSVQVVRMLEWHENSRGALFHVGYVTLLFLGVIAGMGLVRSGAGLYRKASMFAAVLVVVATAIPIVVATRAGQSASFYENFVGEGITILLACVLGVLAVFLPAPSAGSAASR